MFRWLKKRLFSTVRSRAGSLLRPSREPNEETDHFATLRQARQLCEAIDRGAELGLWNHLEHLAEAAAKLAWFDAPLAQRLAKIKVALGEPETALAMLDRGVNVPGRSRLLRIACLLHTGARMEAQLALHEWLREAGAMRMPADGRLLLALLEWQAGDVDHARRLLRDAAASATDDDARWTKMTLVLLAASMGQWDRATDRARTLMESDDGLPEREIAIMLDSLRLGTPVDPAQQRQERIEQMASELPAHAHLIEPLAQAQRRQFDAPVAEELTTALKQAFPHLGAHQATACEAIAQLSALLGESDEAITWARRGLVLNPMSARLALLLKELETGAKHDQRAAHEERAA